MSSAQRIYCYRLQKNRERYSRQLRMSSWEVDKKSARLELSALELLKPHHVYLITRLRDGDHALFYPKTYYSGSMQFWNLAEQGHICSVSSDYVEKNTTKIS